MAALAAALPTPLTFFVELWWLCSLLPYACGWTYMYMCTSMWWAECTFWIISLSELGLPINRTIINNDRDMRVALPHSRQQVVQIQSKVHRMHIPH
jgi:hypothetical protein